MEDKRRHSRWQLASNLLVRESGTDSEGFQAKTNDISIGGLCFLSPRMIVHQTELDFVIDFPDEKNSIFAKGKVVWEKEKILDDQQRVIMTGVSFDILRDADKERIFNYAYKFCREDLAKKWWQGVK
ncbi:MAG: PilZ domain-containing protein [Candidatus Omnitrophota bacterium]